MGAVNDFNPGEGWREVTFDKAVRPYVASYPDEKTGRYWVREEPVPPLPTEPWTVIRVNWKHQVDGSPDVLMLLDYMSAWAYNMTRIKPEHLAERITGFKVLAAPVIPDDEPVVLETTHELRLEQVRRETAKAVLTFVSESLGQRRIRADGLRDVLSNARHEFDVMEVEL